MNHQLIDLGPHGKQPVSESRSQLERLERQLVGGQDLSVQRLFDLH